MKKILLLAVLLLNFVNVAFGAVGCDLNDPDRDVKRLFPNSTSYKTTYLSLDEKRLEDVEKRLGDKFSGLYETIDVPYTVYTIFNNKDVVGYIHGINQKGQYGGLQVFLAYDKDGKIADFYYQKLTSKNAKTMRSKEFAKQFHGLSSVDFNKYNPQTRLEIPKTITSIDGDDFFSTLRAVKKNLILMDIFVFKTKEAK
jgi:hypothetical protein